MSPVNVAYRVKELTGPRGLVRVEEPLPQPKAHEVLVRIHAVSLNYRDFAIPSGMYPFPIKPNVVPGSDMAGEVVSIGEGVQEFKIGDRVTANFDQSNWYGPMKDWNNGMGAPIDGVLQTHRVFPEIGLLHVPKHLTYDEAACWPCTGVTAWNALFGSIPLVPGQTVLFQGTGGVCMTGLQLASAMGAKTIITSSSDEKLEIAKKLGATHVINYKKYPDWDVEVNKLTDGKGAQHVFDVVGVNEIEKCFNSVSQGGVISSIGFLGGPPKANPNVPALALSKGACLRGINVGPKTIFEDLLRFVDTNKLKPHIDNTFTFDQAIEAIEYMAKGQHSGKIVVRVVPQ
ncbi:NAD-P-binding protein [Dentipellis sp. KUC8613]|nr:NAD-P-binding protein [Dentipellis sp. KUC8613]